MESKKIMLAGITGMTLCVSGCGKEAKVSSAQEFALDDISVITMDVSSWNIKVMTSNDKKIHVSYEGKGKDHSIQAVQKDGKLAIQQNEAVKSMAEQFSFAEDGRIMLHIPQKNGFSLDIKNGSGEIELETVSFSDFALTNDSGYITMSDVAVKNAELESVSGDITMSGGSCKNADIYTDSAYVTFQDTDICKTVISTDSGEVGINRVNAYDSLRIKTGSGDISVSHETAPDNLSYDISSNSQDVTVKIQNAAVVDTEGHRQGKVGNGKRILAVTSDGGTVIVK